MALERILYDTSIGFHKNLDTSLAIKFCGRPKLKRDSHEPFRGQVDYKTYAMTALITIKRITLVGAYISVEGERFSTAANYCS